MNMKKVLTSVLLALSLLACSTEHSPQDNGDVCKKVRVSIGQSLDIKSRTSIGEDGHSAIWADGDKIALWAKNSAGDFAMQAESFSLYRFSESYDKAIFSAFIDPMEEGEYTYYATYPTPNSVNGTKATYSIASEQRGDTFVGNCDIMVSNPVTARELAEGVINNLNLHFVHKMHALRLTLPNEGKLMNTPVDCIELTFPTAVVGDVTVDAAAPAAAPVLTNGTNTIKISIPEGYSEGDYVWAIIFPTTISGDISYRLFAGEYVSKVRTVTMNKVVEQSHITPMSISVPEPHLVTTITINIADNHLGEEYNTVTVLDPNGNTVQSFEANESEKYNIYIDGIIDAAQYNGQKYTIRYESDNAIVEDVITLQDIEPYRENNLSSTVPYLLYEDFSQAKAVNSNDAYKAGASDESGNSYRKGVLLDSYMTTAGWNAARFKIEAGKAIRINVRYQSGAWVVARYCGRLDTPALKGIKSGSNVAVKVEFDYACYVPLGYKGLSSLDDTSNSVTFYQISKHTSSESSALNGITQNDISSYYTSPTFVRNITEDTFDGNYIPQSVKISGCGHTTRLTWWACTEQESSVLAANCVYYVYLDNIRVSISK